MKTPVFDRIKQPDRLISYWKNEWRLVAAIVVTGTLFNASMSAGPVLLGRIIDAVNAAEAFERILPRVFFYAAVILAIQLMRLLKRYYVRDFANRTAASMRFFAYRNLIGGDIRRLKAENTGELLSRVIGDVDICTEGMRKFTTEVFDTGVLMISYFIVMLGYDVKLTLASCVFVPLAMLAADRMKHRILALNREYRAKLAEVSDVTYDTIENALLFRITGTERQNLELYDNKLNELENVSVRANIPENSLQPLYSALAMLGAGIICFFGGKSVIGGEWTVGDFTAYLSIFAALAVKSGKAAKLFNSVQKSSVSWKRVVPYLKPLEDKENKIELPESVEIDVKSLSFTYPCSDKQVLKAISFTAKKGDIIGVTGPVASGKSTLGMVLQGIYDYGGSIKLCGKELRDYSASGLISRTMHDSCLFTDTIRNNITLGDNGDITPVLNDVCFEEDMKAMSEGENTLVGARGVRLSGGQQARLALARALYHKRPVLVLDDPFAAVDVNTERDITARLRKNYSDCIIILISHRLSCFEACDKVIYIENGVSECGTHNEMLQKCKGYADTFAAQNREAAE